MQSLLPQSCAPLVFNEFVLNFWHFLLCLSFSCVLFCISIAAGLTCHQSIYIYIYYSTYAFMCPFNWIDLHFSLFFFSLFCGIFLAFFSLFFFFVRLLSLHISPKTRNPCAFAVIPCFLMKMMLGPTHWVFLIAQKAGIPKKTRKGRTGGTGTAGTAFFRNRNRNRNRAFLLKCYWGTEKPSTQRNRQKWKPEPLEPFHARTVTEPNGTVAFTIVAEIITELICLEPEVCICNGNKL